LDSLEVIFERLAPELAVLEQRRQHALEQRNHGRVITAAIGVAAFLVAAIAGRELMPFSLLFALIVTVTLGAIVHNAVAGPAVREFTSGFKQDLVRELIRGLAPGLEYAPDHGIHSDDFQSTQLFATRPDRYKTEDRLSGRIGESNVVMAEIHAEERRTRTDSKGNTETYYVTIFQGILLVADFPKHFQGVTRVLPDNESSLFSGIGKAMQGFFPFGSKDLVRLEDPEFENHFQVYASDQVEARYLLSTSLMRRILDLREAWGAAVRLSFLNHNIHLAIPCRRNLFEPGLEQSLFEDGPFRRIAGEIRSCLELVEQLNLDNRIWTREATGPGNPL